MSKKASSDLFQLIQTMSANEKGYFKKFVARHTIGGKNKSVILFDAIELQTRKSSGEYDENEILNKEDVIGSEQLPDLKNHLYELVLKSLESFHSGNSAYSRLKGYLRQIEVLHNKLLFDQCKKLIVKAKKLAIEYEEFLELLDIKRWETSVMNNLHNVEETEKDINAFFNEETAIIEKYAGERKFKRLHDNLFFHLYKKGLIRKKSEMDDLERIIKNPLLNNESNADTFFSRICYYGVYMNYYLQRSMDAKAFPFAKKKIEFIESNPAMLKENTQLYTTAYQNFMTLAGRLKKFDELKTAIENIRKIKTKSHSQNTFVFYWSFSKELEMYIKMGRFKEGMKLVEALSKEISGDRKNDLADYELLFFHFNFAIVCFGNENFAGANKWLNRILNEQMIRIDYYVFAKILNLMTHFELRNDDLLPYLIKSCYRFLYRSNRLYKFETVFLNFFRKSLANVKSSRELLHSFEELKKELNILNKDPFERRAFDFLDVISWLESKIEKRSFADIVKGKAGI